MCTNGVPMFQTYPMESFIMSEKFEIMLGICKSSTRQDIHTVANFNSRVFFENQHISKTVGIKTIRYNVIFSLYIYPCLEFFCIDMILGIIMLLKWHLAYRVLQRVQQNNVTHILLFQQVLW